MLTDLAERLERIEHKLDAILRTLGADAPVGAPAAPVGAESDEEEAPPRSPSPTPSTRRCASEMSRLSREALRSNDPRRAVELASRALESNPDSVAALRARGAALAAQGAWERARADLSNAQQIDYDQETDELLKESCARCANHPAASKPEPPRPGPTSPGPTSPGGVDLASMASMMKDPAVMGSVADVLKNPEAMRAIQDSPLFRSMIASGASPLH